MRWPHPHFVRKRAIRCQAVDGGHHMSTTKTRCNAIGYMAMLMHYLIAFLSKTNFVTSFARFSYNEASMRGRATKFLACVLVTLFVSSVAAPGLTMHNCRQFGTKSTQLCACCEAELVSAKGCCEEKSEPVAPSCHDASPVSVESTCCFVSYEGPFSFAGQNSSQVSAPTVPQSSVLASQQADTFGSTPLCEIAQTLPNYDTRHSSDPPSYLLTHSFRC